MTGAVKGSSVMFVIGSLDRGGAEGQLIALSRRLLARDWRVTILCLTRGGAQAEHARASGIEVVVAGFAGVRLWNPVLVLRAVAGARRVIASRRPDVVHTHLEWANLIGVPAARLAGVPVVVGSRLNLMDIIYAKHFKWAVRALEWLTARWADAVVCNAHAVLEDSVRHGLSRRRGRVIYNGVDLPPNVDQTAEGEVRIAVVANLHRYKGHRFLLDAFSRMLARLEDGQTPLLELAGAGGEEASLRAQARGLGIQERVRFLGSVSDVGRLLDRAAFTVLPSLSEGLPNAVLESLAYGRAVVASAVGGVPEILETGGGILVAPGDVAALEEALFRLVSDPARRAALAEEGRRAATERFGMERLAAEHESLYRELLATSRRRRRWATSTRTPPAGQPTTAPGYE